jgi:hypothetical protein
MSESTVVSPQAGQAVILTENDRHRQMHGDHYPAIHAWELSRDFASVRKDVCELGDATALGFSVTQKQVSDAATATVVGFKDSLAIAYQVEGRALLEAAKNANAVAVQNTNNFNLIQIEQVKNAAAAELSARTIAAAAAAQAAECCCELKALIVSDGNSTRALINAQTEQNLRDKIARLEMQNAALFTRNTAPITPVVV